MKTALIAPVADTGDDLETLKALRHKLADTIDKSESGRDIAALSRQLQMVMNQITELEQQGVYDEDAELLENLITQKKAVRGRGGATVYEDLEE